MRAQDDASHADVELSGTVRIAAPDAFSTLFLCPRLGKLRAQFPSITVQLVPMSRALSLSKREADLAITIERPEEGRLAVRKLVDYSLYHYAADSYLAEHKVPQDGADLERHSLVTYVQDLIFANQLNFIPEVLPLSVNSKRFALGQALGCSTTMRRIGTRSCRW